MTTAFNTPGATQNIAAVPKPTSTPIQKTEEGGWQMAKDWWRYLLSLTAAPAIESAVTLGTSITTYTAKVNGTLLITGGTGITLTINSRQNPLNNFATGITAGFVPMSVGDSLNITYTNAPLVTWFPR